MDFDALARRGHRNSRSTQVGTAVNTPRKATTTQGVPFPGSAGCAQQPTNVTPFPLERPFVLAELTLALEELRRMKDAASDLTPGRRDVRGRPARVAPRRRDHVVEHLVVDDRRDEVTRHPGAIEHGMDSNDPLERRIATQLDRLPRSTVFALRPSAPRDECVAPAREIPLIQVVEDREEVVARAFRVQRYRSWPPRAT